LVSSRSTNESGFAYMWTLFLVALIGASLARGVEIYATTLQRDREQELLFIGNQFRQAIRSYYEIQLTNGKHDYPPSLDDLITDPRTPGKRRHLRKVYVDPITGADEWGLMRVGGGIVGVHSRSDITPLKQDHFDGDDVGFVGKTKISEWVFTFPGNLILQQDGNPAVQGTQQNVPPPVSNSSLSFEGKK